MRNKSTNAKLGAHTLPLILKRRHIVKALTWRIIATISTFLITWSITGELHTGLKVGAYAIAIKMGLYYLHERLWYRSQFGVRGVKH